MKGRKRHTPEQILRRPAEGDEMLNKDATATSSPSQESSYSTGGTYPRLECTPTVLGRWIQVATRRADLGEVREAVAGHELAR